MLNGPDRLDRLDRGDRLDRDVAPIYSEAPAFFAPTALNDRVLPSASSLLLFCFSSSFFLFSNYFPIWGVPGQAISSFSLGGYFACQW